MFNNYRPNASNRIGSLQTYTTEIKKPVKPHPRLRTDRIHKKKSGEFTSRLALCLNYFKKKIFFHYLRSCQHKSHKMLNISTLFNCKGRNRERDLKECSMVPPVS